MAILYQSKVSIQVVPIESLAFVVSYLFVGLHYYLMLLLFWLEPVPDAVMQLILHEARESHKHINIRQAIAQCKIAEVAQQLERIRAKREAVTKS